MFFIIIADILHRDLEHHKAEFAKLPMQEERDAAYTRKMAEHPLYFVQSCHTGEIVQMFHAAAEDPSVLNLKKSFLQTISVRMNGKQIIIIICFIFLISLNCFHPFNYN